MKARYNDVQLVRDWLGRGFRVYVHAPFGSTPWTKTFDFQTIEEARKFYHDVTKD